MSNASDIGSSNILNILSNVASQLSYEKICELSKEQKAKYCELLSEFKRINKLDNKTQGCPSNINARKGKALENIVSYLLEVSGGIFNIDRNLRTSTNEIDLVVKLNINGKILQSNGIINQKFSDDFICECKNYDKSISVTYVGKFCSLLLTNNIKLGILFSYHGVSGRDWNNGAGLIKKFYLHKENLNERYCVLDFNIEDFEAVNTGKNLLDIIDKKLDSLRYDTDYSKFLSKHPAE